MLLGLFIAFVVLFIGGIVAQHPIFIPAIGGMMILLLLNLYVPVDAKELKVRYEIFPVREKIIVKTSNGMEFSSERKQDFDEWDGKRTGYIISYYNSFKLMITQKFVTKAVEE